MLNVGHYDLSDGKNGGNYKVVTQGASGTITPASLTASLTGTVEKVYDGSTAANLTNANYNLNGLVSGDTVLLAGSGSYDNKDVGINKVVTSAGYTISGADAVNYTLSSIDGSVSGKITARPLTASVTAANKVYDGTTAATISGGITLGNFIAGDTVSATYSSGVFADKNVGDHKTVALSGIALDGIDKGNYTLAANSITSSASITPATLTITAKSDSKVYDGTTGSTVTPTYTGLVSGESLGNLTQAYASKNVLGEDRSTLQVSEGYTLTDGNGGNSGNNYQVTVHTAKGTITPAQMTASLTGTVEKVYDGNTMATLRSANGTLSGLKGTDAVAVSGTGSYDSKNVGSRTLTVTGVNLVGADAGNYELSGITGSVSGSITKAALTLSANDAKKTYDKLPYSGGNGVYGSGFAAGEGLGDLAGTLAYGGNSQGAVEVGKYGISVTGVTSNNYDITFLDGTLTVNKAAMTEPAYNAAVQNSQQSGAAMKEPQQNNAVVPQTGASSEAPRGAVQTASVRYADGSIGRTLSVSGGDVTIGGGLVQVNMGAPSSDVAVYTSSGQQAVYRFDAAHSVLSLREGAAAPGAAASLVAGSGERASFQLQDAAGHTAVFVMEYYGSGATVTAQNEAARGMLNQPQLLTAAALAAGQDKLGLEADAMKELLLR